MKPITVPCTLDSATRRKDRSVTLKFSSNLEVTSEDYLEMDRRLHKAGWLLWSENELQLEDIPTHDAPTEERKSKGQRLRAVYFLIWRKLGTDEPFDTWWDRQFERLLDQLKDKIE